MKASNMVTNTVMAGTIAVFQMMQILLWVYCKRFCYVIA